MSQPLDIFYPIVPDAAWLARLAPLGIRTVQLRLKDAGAERVSSELSQAMEIARRHDLQLIINDYWREAIAAGASYVHLGQEDLASADLLMLRAAGIKFGISTHSEMELATALAAKPDYVALGPIWETKLKAMRWAPQGLEKIERWRHLIGDLPLVAIGGITPERAPGVLSAGANSVAVITDFLTHADPDARVREWVGWAGSVREASRERG